LDPQAAFDQLAEAYEEGDMDLVRDLAQGLREWLRKGGFAPRIAGRESFDRMVALMVVERF